MHHFRRQFLLSALLMLLFAGRSGGAGTRIKDLVMVSGARDNQLIGYGLVTGLANDGDKNPLYTQQTLANMLQRFNISVPSTTLSAKNIAVVMITADIPAYARNGTRLDVNVSSMGDAKSLQGGVLLQTPLYGADGSIYAVAQGPLSVGGFIGGSGGAGGATVQKNHPTVAQIIGGALVEREIPATIVREQSIELLLRQPDFTSAARIAAAINDVFPESADARDWSTIRVQLPFGTSDFPVEFIARIEAIEVNPDMPAKIVINERTGTIVANSKIKISSCAVSHGNLTINIASTVNVSQPAPFAQKGDTVAVPSTDTAVNEATSSMVALPDLPSVQEVATSLNALGVTPRDMMAIFQAMKQAGALQAELIIK